MSARPPLPDHMRDSMVSLLRDEGYLVLAAGTRPLRGAAERALVAAMARVELPHVVAAARNQRTPWHEPAVAELVRRGAFDELETVRAGWARAAAPRSAAAERRARAEQTKRASKPARPSPLWPLTDEREPARKRGARR